MQAPLFIAASALFIVGVLGAPPNKPNVKEVIQATAKKCAAQTKASPEQAKIIFTKNLPKDEVERCYMECVFSGVGVVKDGKFSEQGSEKLAELRFNDDKQKQLAKQLIKSCSTEIVAKEGEKCSLGKEIRQCFLAHGKEVNFFPSAA